MLREKITKSNHLLFVAGFFMFLQGGLQACGIGWNLPRSYFDGVSAQGKVLYSDKIGELDLGEGLKLPLYVFFKSDWENNSPYLGQGWMLPLLESRLEQVDENTFKMWMPDGWYKFFWRDNKDKNILHSGGGWVAQIQGDTITTWADCGWKVVYTKGKIVSMSTPQSRTFVYLYAANNRISEIRENGMPILRVKTDQQGDVSGLEMGGKVITFGYGQKPQVQNINGQNLIGAVTKSMNRVVQADGVTKTFAYGTTNALEPTLAINDDRVIVWDAKTKIIKKDGDWSYHINPNVANFNANVAIDRANAKGQHQYWFNESWLGRETIIAEDGSKTVAEWFVSGTLAGNIRSIVTTKNGTTVHSFSNVFDDKGRLLRINSNDFDARRTYSDGSNSYNEEIVGHNQQMINVSKKDKETTIEAEFAGNKIKYSIDEKGLHEIK
ncbi:MAG: hypothetical protein LBH01_06495 [Verrucomicrobiales bacterium]|nr:hypothetical protein [Verrucomicrobiales bacterium]